MNHRCSAGDEHDAMAYGAVVSISPRRTLFTRERGASLVGVLVVLIILGAMGAMGAVAVSAIGGNAGTTLATTPHEFATRGSTPSAGKSTNVVTEAALSATCVADFTSLTTALQVYATLHGANPPAGTSWVLGIQSGSASLTSWPSDPGHFTFKWNGTTLTVVPRRGASSGGSVGSAASSSGCYAPLS